MAVYTVLLLFGCAACVQSNLGSRTPRIVNSSAYEQIF
jgi:hypothetical protein